MPLADVTTSYLSPGVYSTLPLWPLLGAILAGILIALRAKAQWAHWPVVLGVLVSAALGVTFFFDLEKQHGAGHEADEPVAANVEHDATAHEHSLETGHGEHAAGDHLEHNPTYEVYDWISLGAEESLSEANDHWLTVSFYFDGLTGIMLLFFTVVSLLIMIYSIGYMRDHHGHPERGYERFFAFMGVFVFSMAMLVMAGNFVLLYLGWELVGLCSYLLIGFYYKRPSAAAAAKKAFIVNRIGDFGFALGIFALYMFLRGYIQPGENPLDYAVVFKYAHHMAAAPSGFLGMSQATLVGLLLMCGALGKSAQFPLYVWLPDAMEGPSPVSALIHAATMVTAGIYMVARCMPIFAASQVALDVIITLGVIGAMLTATMAMAQYDMKRILAYSTISQLAYMFVALGCAAPDSAIFHVFTHSWFKALLFLGAGSVMHQMGGIIDIRKFSGLRHILPKTYAVMWVGCLALAGFPLFAGFWSKDEIVHAAFERHTLVGVLLLITAFLTAYYTFRMFFMCFHGKLKLPAEAGEHPHESPRVMIWPLYVLALGAIFTGYLGVSFHGAVGEKFLGIFKPHGFFHHYIAQSSLGHTPHAAGGMWLMYVSMVVALAGIGLAWLRYGKAPEEEPDRKLLGFVWDLWNAKYCVDEVYDYVFVRPLRGLGRFFFGTDNYGVDGIIWFVAAVPRGAGYFLHLLQRGVLQTYALCMVIGVALLLLLWSWLDKPIG
ncbi:MAG: NADH-quinone oxidoreductase subunit L [Phycisphaerae bacterium]|nr:NADH-quinone oxidoreductase subunit L [Phycisphaerae bacterium]